MRKKSKPNCISLDPKKMGYVEILGLVLKSWCDYLMTKVFKELFLVLMFHCCRKYPTIYCRNGQADVFICAFLFWTWCHYVLLICSYFLLLLAGLCSLRLELEQHAHSRTVSPCSHQCRHLWHEGSLAVRRDVLLLVLLAY